VSEERILTTVKRVVAASLAISMEEVTPEKRLIDDLGADSLDFVDIVFALDRELDIRVRETEFNFLTRLDFSSPEVMQGSFLALPIVERLMQFLPALRQVPDPASITPRMMFSCITVESIGIVCAQALSLREPRASG
jgi:acyl carrier protein